MELPDLNPELQQSNNRIHGYRELDYDGLVTCDIVDVRTLPDGDLMSLEELEYSLDAVNDKRTLGLSKPSWQDSMVFFEHAEKPQQLTVFATSGKNIYSLQAVHNRYGVTVNDCSVTARNQAKHSSITLPPGTVMTTAHREISSRCGWGEEAPDIEDMNGIDVDKIDQLWLAREKYKKIADRITARKIGRRAARD